VSAGIQAYIADFLARRRLADRDGFSVKAANAIARLSAPTEEAMIAALSALPTELYRRNSGVQKRALLSELVTQILAKKLIRVGATMPSRCLVLCLAANPAQASRLQIDEEIRSIQAKIRESEHREYIMFEPLLAARADDLLRAVNEKQPSIVHFSGHGTATGDLAFAADAAAPHLVSGESFASVLALFRPKPKLVLMNACYSSTHADDMLGEVDVVVGMKKSISDESAIDFSGAFYRAIGFGRTVREAFEQGVVALRLNGSGEASVPRLICRDGVDPGRLVLFEVEA